MNTNDVFRGELLPPYPDYNRYLGNSREIREAPHIDWTVVSMARSAEHIKPAARLSHDIGSMLLVLCSHEANPEEVVRTLEGMHAQPGAWFVVNVRPGYTLPDVEFTVGKAIPEHARKEPGWDLSLKRNIGLLVGKATALRSLFIDDDLKARKNDILPAAELSQYYEIVGLQNDNKNGFRDKSTFMHGRDEIEAYHVTAGYKDQIGAGMVSTNSEIVDVERNTEHFMDIYNEDWFFAIERAIAGQVAVADTKYRQLHFDPFADERRIRGEEFGDNAAYGVYNLLTNKVRRADLLDKYYWERVIEDRREGYLGMLALLGARRNPDYLTREEVDRKQFDPMPRSLQDKLRKPLEAGLAMNETLEGDMFVDFVNAWQEDKLRAARMFHDLPDLFGAERVLAHLDLAYITGGRGQKTTRHGMR